MPDGKIPFHLIDNQTHLETFYKENKSVKWLCFDTEFVGEKRYQPLLCLIQVVTEHGNYIIDPFEILDLSPFLELVKDPGVLKVTHAGENDYRLLNHHFQVLPSNVFDTQIAAGFLGYKYPISFQKLVDGELGIKLKKGYAVADWERRPFQGKQLKYALEDVVPLFDLWKKQELELNQKGRMNWASQEFAKLEQFSFYNQPPHKEALSHKLMRSLNPKERLFLVRILDWRRQTAESKDYSKEMVLPNKMISHIIRSIASGNDALKKNRRIPDKLVQRHGDLFIEFFERAASEEELAILAKIPPEVENEQEEDLLIELLYLLLKNKCTNNEVSPSIVMSKNTIGKMKTDGNLKLTLLKEGWRNELLGHKLTNWLMNIENLEADFGEEHITIKIKDKA